MTETSYQELLRQRAELDKKIEDARALELNSALKQIRQLMADYGITAQEIMPAGTFKGEAKQPRSKVAPKYRDPDTGKTWTGRGKPPAWIAGKDRAEFAIEGPAD